MKKSQYLYQNDNLTTHLIRAQHRRNLVEQLRNIKGSLHNERPFQFSPQRNRHSSISKRNNSKAATKLESARQREIDVENNVLLGKIIQIMKRKNKSLSEVRQVAQMRRTFGLGNTQRSSFYGGQSQRGEMKDGVPSERGSMNDAPNVQASEGGVKISDYINTEKDGQAEG